jgi:sulfonate transport system ATP-binding protein
VDRLLALTGLTDFATSFPKVLSGGMLQRVAIARALLRDPAVMLLDEPFGALDSFTRSQMQDVLTDVWTKNRTTMLFVTHDIEEAITLGDRIVVMSPRPGRIDRVIELGFEHPRDRRSAEFQRVRTELIERFEEIGQGDGGA